MKKLKILLSLFFIINMTGCSSKKDTSFKLKNISISQNETVDSKVEEETNEAVIDKEESNAQSKSNAETVNNNQNNNSVKEDNNTSNIANNTEQSKESEQTKQIEQPKEDTSYLNVINRGDYDSSVYYYYNLTDTDKDKYDLILNGINNHDEFIHVSGDFDSICVLVNKIIYDHPEIFWLDGAFEFIYNEDNNEADLKFNYLFDTDTTNYYRNLVEEAGSTFKNTISASDSDYEVIKKVYSYVVDNVSYDAISSNNQNIISSLLDHSSVCAGYAKMTQYLLQRCGLKALYVSGSASGEDGIALHAWVIVKWDGNYYHIDTTYADGYGVSSSGLSSYDYPYLCLSDSVMFKNHTPDYVLSIPSCDSDILSKFQN